MTLELKPIFLDDKEKEKYPAWLFEALQIWNNKLEVRK